MATATATTVSQNAVGPNLGHNARNNFMITSNPRNSMSIQNSKGLLNMPGQNNCFLNSAVQVLWHLDIFRRSFRDISGHACMAESCIFCALKELFAQFQYSNESALPPDALRRALAETFFNQQRFQLGHMDDAAECFENILTRIHFHIANSESEDMCNSLHCIPHQKFAMTLVEQSICHSCGATSEPLTFTQMVHYVSASALCAQSSIMDREGKTDVNVFGHLLRKAGGMGDFRDCPSACGAKIQICRTLMNCPDIVSVGVVWDSDHPPLDHILDVFRAIGTSMQLQNVFHSVVDKRWGTTTHHQLVGVVTYYGKHYSTFFFHTKLKVWIYFDDATVREIGPHWEQVIEKCCRGHFQPLLLLYASPNGSPISMEGAPQTVTMVPAQKQMPMQSMNIKASQKYPTQQRSLTPSIEAERPKLHRKVERQQSVDDLLQQSAATNPDNFNTYISRKAVENVLQQQKLSWQQQQSPNSKMGYNSGIAGNRNSNSSLESFENALKNRMIGGDMPDGPHTLRRRDSGNWSGDRNSASSASSTSQENPYFFLVGKSRSQMRGHPSSPKRAGPDFPNIMSDAGYDSFSLSSTDSFPSITSQGKYDVKLCQIPENALSLINADHFPPQGFADDCDRLCFEADQLLLLSQEKENEGDLAMALTLSDCAASKARAAMDAPYNNSKSIMAAKMKHSTCVMRSCSLHRRLAQEMKETKASEGRHSRQSSRDSTKSNKSSKEKSSKDSIEKQNKNSIDIYGTLPKKHSRRRCNSSGSSSELKAAALRATGEVKTTQEVYVKSEGKRTVRDIKQEHKHKKQSRDEGIKYKEYKKQLLDGYLSVDAADYSDYYSEWDDGKKHGLSRTYSGTQTPSAKCKDDLNQSLGSSSNKKQHKVRRKLLMGGLIRRKNRSMPDLTDMNDDPADFKQNIDSSNVEHFHSELNSVMHSRGFLQPHPAFMRSNSKLPQPNRLPPPPPVRIPTTKLTSDISTVEQIKSMPKTTKVVPVVAASQESETNRSQSPFIQPKEYPEYMNLQNIQKKINYDFSPRQQILNSQYHQNLNNRAPTPEYMNTMDYMSMCKSSPNNFQKPNLPEYMNLQYLRDIQNESEYASGPGSLPLPPPPSPQSITPGVADLPLPPPPDQLMGSEVEEPKPKLSPFLLELKAKKEELERKAQDKADAEPVAEDKTSAKKSAWLEELQAKQNKMKQKKHTEYKDTGNTPETVATSPAPSNLVKNKDGITLTKRHVEKKITPATSPPSANTPTLKDNSARSVRDLASKFEKIMKTPPEAKNEDIYTSSDEVDCDKKASIQNLDERIKNLKSPAMRRKCESAKNDTQNTSQVAKHAPVITPKPNVVKECSPSIMFYKEMTEEEEEEIAKCTDKNTQSNALLTDSTLNKDINAAFNRPLQPPDYETAMKRIGQREINNNSLEMKKKRPSRRSVTFSDQVVLVACANTDEEEYMPHPLLEKAFKQHSEKSETSTSSPEAKANLCDLCHSEPIVSPETYCANCSIYMSRFRPKS